MSDRGEILPRVPAVSTLTSNVTLPVLPHVSNSQKYDLPNQVESLLRPILAQPNVIFLSNVDLRSQFTRQDTTLYALRFNQTPLSNLASKYPLSENARIYVYYSISGDFNDQELEKINSYIESDPVLAKRTQSMLIINRSKQVHLNMYEDGFRTDYFKITHYFPNFTIQPSGYVYQCTSKLTNKIWLDSNRVKELLLNEQVLFSNGYTEKESEYKDGKPVLDESGHVIQKPTTDRGIVSIVKRMQLGMNERLVNEWKWVVAKTLRKIVGDIKHDEAVLEYYKQNKLNVNKELKSYAENAIFYEEVVKMLLIQNSNYSVQAGMLTSSDPRQMIREKLEIATLSYLNDFLDMHEHKELLEYFIQQQRMNMDQEFFIPLLYKFDPILFNWFQDKYAEGNENTYFNTSLYFTSSNLIGKCLRRVLMDKYIPSTTKSQYVMNTFIIDQMKMIAPKVLLFFNETMSTSSLLELLQVLLDCDFTRFLATIPEEAVTLAMTQVQQINLPRQLNEDEKRRIMGVLYHYSLYCYQLIQQTLSKTNPSVTDAMISNHMDKVRSFLISKPDIKSELFPYGLDGCLIEAFFEFTIAVADVTSVMEITDMTVDVWRNVLFSFIGIRVGEPAGGLTWLSDERVMSMYKVNGIKIERPVAISIRDKIITHLVGAMEVPDNRPHLYKFIRQFTQRKHILPSASDDTASVVLTSVPEYDLTLLMEEQVYLRKSRRPEIHDVIPVPDVMKKENETLIRLLQNVNDEATVFATLNRLNAMEAFAQGVNRKYKLLPVVDHLNKLLSEKEMALADREKKYVLFKLYQQKNTLLLSEAQCQTIQAALLNILIKETIAKQQPVLGSLFTEETNKILLINMGRYDLTHMFLFYSILSRCHEVTDPNKILKIYPEIMLLNQRQSDFLIDLLNHVTWLEKMGIFKIDHPFSKVLRLLVNDDFTPKYHIADIDVMDPSSNAEWILRTIRERNKQVNDLVNSRLTPMSIINQWSRGLKSSVNFIDLLNKYVNLSRLSKKDISEWIQGINQVIQDTVDVNFQSFLNELKQQAVRMWYILTENVKLSLKDVMETDQMLSYYRYGMLTNTITEVLFTHPYDQRFSKQMAQIITYKNRIEAMNRALSSGQDRLNCPNTCTMSKVSQLKPLAESMRQAYQEMIDARDNKAKISRSTAQENFIYNDFLSRKTVAYEKLKETFNRLEREIKAPEGSLRIAKSMIERINELMTRATEEEMVTLQEKLDKAIADLEAIEQSQCMCQVKLEVAIQEERDALGTDDVENKRAMVRLLRDGRESILSELKEEMGKLNHLNQEEEVHFRQLAEERTADQIVRDSLLPIFDIIQTNVSSYLPSENGPNAVAYFKMHIASL